MDAVRIQLTWTHLRSIMFIEDDSKRTFYMEMCRLERWDTRTLNEKTDSQLYELTALSKKPEEVIKRELARIKETHTLTPDVVFRSDYFLDTLGLTNVYSEKDLEDAILVQIQSFIKELGTDFAFLDRQRRITVDATDYSFSICSEGNTEHIEYLMLDDNNIRVAQYYTQLPDKKLLSEKLQRAIAIARGHYTNVAGK